jgi:serine-type D-Ala-D-Ala carboxypeptidase/endopeptidase (penicillin-binding protein 4)
VQVPPEKEFRHYSVRAHVRRALTVLLLIVCLCGTVTADLAKRVTTSAKSKLPNDYAIYIIKADSGTAMFSHNPDKLLIPASNMKVITTAAAVKYLGLQFEYKTRIGICEGNVIVIGSGDPILGDAKTDEKHGRKPGWIFEQIVKALQDKGITEVNDIIVDATVFDQQRVHPEPTWSAADLNRWYACETSGLNYNTNCIQITVEKQNRQAVFSVDPQTAYVQITNSIRTISSGNDTVGAYRSPKPNVITLKGTIKDKEGPFDVAIEGPATFFGTLLAESLGRSGIAVRGHVVEKAFADNAKLTPLTEFTTPLSDVLQRANKNSLGLAAEALVKTIAAHETPGNKDGSWKRGFELITSYLKSLGVAENQFHLSDGSGLSRDNRLSAQTLVAVLRDLYRGPNWEFYKATLAVGGEDGTVARYFKEAKYQSNILGKTGYILGVHSFSGVCLTANGPYLFSILSNKNSLSRDAENDIAAAIIDEYGPGD